MAPRSRPEIVVRPATPEDVAASAQICYQAFSTISANHNFPCDLPHADAASGLLSAMFGKSGFYSVVAEVDGRIVGSNVLDERSVIAGVGPITIDPAAQNLGIGRKLMQAVHDRAESQHAVGVRLVQAAFHNRSLSLYSSLGFDIREPLSCLQGPPMKRTTPGCTVRPAQVADLGACNTLCRQVHGFERGTELAQAIQQNTALVVERASSITGYASSVAFFGHTVAQTNLDLQALIAGAEAFGGPGFLLPSRNTVMLRWCLANGLRVVQPMTLMTTGLYNDPAGAWLPSIMF
jgi:predicted N-acetyltransferase YhbS